MLKFLIVIHLISSFVTGWPSTNTELAIYKNVIYLSNKHRNLGNVLAIEINIQGVDKDHVHGNTARPSDQHGLTWTIYLPHDEVVKISQTRLLDVDRLSEYKFNWKIVDTSGMKEVCFRYKTAEFSKSFWYSTYYPDQSDSRKQFWPLNYKNLQTSTLSYPTDGTSVVEHLFINSDGFAVMLDDLHFWTIYRNSDKLCISTSLPSDYPLKNIKHKVEYDSIKFRILVGSDIKEVWRGAVAKLGYISRPVQAPEESLMKFPIFPVLMQDSNDKPKYWEENVDIILSRYKDENWLKFIIAINQPAVWKQGKKVGHGQRIEDSFELSQGSRIIKQQQLSQNETLMSKINADRHLVSIEISPSIAIPINSQLARFTFGQCKIALCEAYLDFSSLETREWFTEKLRQFQHYSSIGIFMNTLGSAQTFVHGMSTLHASDELVEKFPNFINTYYGKFLSQLNEEGSISVGESAFKAQSGRSFVRIKIQADNQAQALKELIPRVLTASLAGYQHMIPELKGYQPDKKGFEFFIRWMQAIAFMPAVTIPTFPWIFDNPDAERIFKETLKLREQLFNGVRMASLPELSANWSQHGEPIIRPMWYADPSDERLYEIDDQFMVGNDLLVAPITDLTSTTRSVYFPPGTWLYGKVYHKSGTIGMSRRSQTYDVSIDDLLYFWRIE